MDITWVHMLQTTYDRHRPLLKVDEYGNSEMLRSRHFMHVPIASPLLPSFGCARLALAARLKPAKLSWVGASAESCAAVIL